MRRRLRLGSTVLALLLLCGCGGTSHAEKQEFLRLRTKWLAAGSAALRAAVRADYGDRVYDFVLSYEGDAENGLLTVEEPQSIRGVEVALGPEGVSLRFDGAVLDTGAILGELSPLEAFPTLVRAWQSGCVTDCWRETREGRSCLTAEIDLTPAGAAEPRVCRTWFDRESGQPIRAEFLADGRGVLYCTFLETG